MKKCNETPFTFFVIMAAIKIFTPGVNVTTAVRRNFEGVIHKAADNFSVKKIVFDYNQKSVFFLHW